MTDEGLDKQLNGNRGSRIKEAFDFKGRPIPELKDLICINQKIRRVYEDEDFIIDILKEENDLPVIRVSVFDEHGRFLDHELIYKKDFMD